ncbi:extracellular dihydrogeodin oxidase/laccase [Aspergillus luchuensis]|uniref:Extracellular dihydrogeodin oxidase/laccase n=1 Tax=Aspergillus kawachii TaxID=1069201 RepID=A0A146FTN5_ASPKA|nr:extracellular dihydrogeodin oxidase/laccase [Aspergillus luchuensis]
MAECNGNARQQSLNQLNGTEALGRCPVSGEVVVITYLYGDLGVDSM